MTTRPKPGSEDSVAGFGWPNRILILAIAGIIFLTLYPFRFTLDRYLLYGASPFFLGGSGKAYGPLDALLNVLLFVPFGFGLAGKFRERGKSRMAALVLTLAAGALFSYSIEFLQFFIPERDSGWNDVVTNSTGTLVGCLAFQSCGLAVFRLLNGWERAIAAFATVRNTAIVLLLYFALCFAVSGRLQEETALSNWNLDALLVVGNSASGRSASAWRRKVYQLEFWDRALPDEAGRSLTSAGTAGLLDASALAEYDFSGSPPIQDQHHNLPDLELEPKASASTGSKAILSGGTPWLATGSPVSAMAMDFQNTRQFSVLVRCQPAGVDEARARILSISQVSGLANMEILQEYTDLVFWFRNPLSVKRSALAWNIPKVFAAMHPRDILFSYDGSNLSLFIDGEKYRRTFDLGPGAALASTIRRIKTAELDDYKYIFYALVFFPAGCLLGLTWRKMPAQPFGRFLLVLLGFLLPSVLFEIVLVSIGGQRISLGNIWLAVLIVCMGSLWINAGDVLRAPARSSNQASAK